jgi:hypothetical protein
MPRCFALVAIAVLVCVAAGRLAAGGDSPGVPGPERLTAAERAAVRKLTEQALKDHGLASGKVYLTRIDVFADGGTGERHAIAISYRYEGDLAVLTHIDLGTLKVTEVETVPHLPTSLSPEELAEAEKLARANREVARALARYGEGARIEVDAQMLITAVPDAPEYRHRVVRLFFRRGRDYLLYVPNVDVDLTRGTVRVRPAGQGHDRGSDAPTPGPSSRGRG